MAPYPRRPSFSYSPPLAPDISQAEKKFNVTTCPRKKRNARDKNKIRLCGIRTEEEEEM
jgi:hypothetical protein